MLGHTKKLAKLLLPDFAYSKVRQLRMAGRRLSTGLAYLGAGYRPPEILLHFYGSLGDHLVCTSVVRELKKRGYGSVWMVSNFPDLFKGLTDVARVIPVDVLVDSRFVDFVNVWRVRIPRLDYAPW